jgi:hypothetical protein
VTKFNLVPTRHRSTQLFVKPLLRMDANQPVDQFKFEKKARKANTLIDSYFHIGPAYDDLQREVDLFTQATHSEERKEAFDARV